MENGMTLQELTTRLQSLCHDGYAQHKIVFGIEHDGVKDFKAPGELSISLVNPDGNFGAVNVNLI